MKSFFQVIIVLFLVVKFSLEDQFEFENRTINNDELNLSTTISTEIKERQDTSFFGIDKKLRNKFQIRHRRAIPLREVILNRIFGRRPTTTTLPPTTPSRPTTSSPPTSPSTPSRPTTSSPPTRPPQSPSTVSTTSPSTTPSSTSSPSITNASDFNNKALYTNPYFFPKRNGIVELFEWKYLDIAQECEEYLAPNGFAGVQVSPPTENLKLPGRPWYERYQPISYEIKSRSGDTSDFLEMALRCNAVGIRIYVDIVINHMTANFNGTASGTGGAYAMPETLYYPSVSYSKSDFHQSCEIADLDDPVNVRNCELEGLHDLDQSKENVRWTIILLLNKLIALGATGFRIGAAEYVWPEDLKYIYDHINNLPTDFGYPNNSKPFIYQEVRNDNWKFDYANLGTVVTEFTHPDNMGNIFNYAEDVEILNKYGTTNMLPSQLSLTFVDDHDLQRQSSYTLSFKKNPKALKAAYAFTLGYPYGIPRIMSSYDFETNDNDEDDVQGGPPSDDEEDIISPEFDDNGQCTNGWICEHRWNAITNMINFRNVVNDAPVNQWWNNGDGVFSFCRGNKGFVLINTGKTNFNGVVRTCLPKGIYCDIISGKLENGVCTKRQISVDGSRRAAIKLLKSDSEAAIVLHINMKRK